MRLSESRLQAAIGTTIDGLFDTERAECWVGSATGANDISAATVIAEQRGASVMQLFFKRGRLHAKLLVFRFKRGILGLKIGVLSLYCRIFGFSQSKMLTEDRRRAVLVDQFFQMVKKTHDKPHNKLDEENIDH